MANNLARITGPPGGHIIDIAVFHHEWDIDLAKEAVYEGSGTHTHLLSAAGLNLALNIGRISSYGALQYRLMPENDTSDQDRTHDSSRPDEIE